jgi:hypothetical protein
MIWFLAYLTVDFFNCYFLIQDESSGAMQNYFHHILGVGGAVAGLACGRYILTLSCATFITEFSSIFVSTRALLSMHKKTDGMFYIINGLVMTFSFGLVRVVF